MSKTKEQKSVEGFEDSPEVVESGRGYGILATILIVSIIGIAIWLMMRSETD